METFSALLAICGGNSPVTAQRQVMQSFDVLYDLRLNKRLRKQSWGWWFETPSHPLWRHCNDYHSCAASDGAWWSRDTVVTTPTCIHSLLVNIQRHIDARTKFTPFRRRYFQMHSLQWNVGILIKFSMKFVPKGPINNIPALVQIMAWRRPGDKPLSEPLMARLAAHICVTRPQRVKKYTIPI